MSKAFLLDPPGVVQRLATRYRNQCRHWLAGGGDWPLSLPLGVPSERQALDHPTRVRAWQDAWACWPGPGEVAWVERRWPVLGTQRLPEAIRLPSPEAVAVAVGQARGWSSARRRLLEIGAIWPVLCDVLPRHFEVLAGWADEDVHRLVALLRWLADHPRCGLYLRQLPVPGVDTKWLETRQGVVKDWLGAISGITDARDLFDLTGLRRTPAVLRMRLLDPALRRCVAGLGDIQAPVADIASLRLPVARALIIENLQTGLALEDLPGAVAFMGQGYRVEPFAEIPWLRAVPCHYWGDLDSHGFAILDRLRIYLPHAGSILMDQETLLTHRNLWVHEPTSAPPQELPRLNESETALAQALRESRWGSGVRLEQERIPWPYVASKIADIAGNSTTIEVAGNR